MEAYLFANRIKRIVHAKDYEEAIAKLAEEVLDLDEWEVVDTWPVEVER